MPYFDGVGTIATFVAMMIQYHECSLLLHINPSLHHGEVT